MHKISLNFHDTYSQLCQLSGSKAPTLDQVVEDMNIASKRCSVGTEICEYTGGKRSTASVAIDYIGFCVNASSEMNYLSVMERYKRGGGYISYYPFAASYPRACSSNPGPSYRSYLYPLPIFATPQDEYAERVKRLLESDGTLYGHQAFSALVMKVKRSVPWVDSAVKNFPVINRFILQAKDGDIPYKFVEIRSGTIKSIPVRIIVLKVDKSADEVPTIEQYIKNSERVKLLYSVVRDLGTCPGFKESGLLAKFANKVVNYAERTGNYKRSRILISVVAKTIKVAVGLLKVGAIFLVCALIYKVTLASEYERLKLGDESIFSFFWHWQERLDTETLSKLGLDPAFYYVYHQLVYLGGNNYRKISSIRRR